MSTQLYGLVVKHPGMEADWARTADTGHLWVIEMDGGMSESERNIEIDEEIGEYLDQARQSDVRVLCALPLGSLPDFRMTYALCSVMDQETAIGASRVRTAVVNQEAGSK